MNIYDIAKLTGVSASTVSRVANGKPGVGKKKRELIEEALRQYHYVPDEMARSLVNQKSQTIGILTDDLDSRRQNEGTAQIENVLMSNGYYCFTKYIGNADNAIENGISDLAKRRVEGALLLGVSFREHRKLASAVERYLPDVPVVLVYQNSRFERENIYSVGADEKKGFRLCVDHLAQKGRKNIVLFIDRGRYSEKPIISYFQEAVSSYADLGMTGWISSGIEPTVSGGQNEMRRMLMLHPNIDGVLCAQDSIAIGAMYACMDYGKRVPEDISVIGEDNSALCEACRPKLTSLDTMVSDCTITSARVLVDVLRGVACSHEIHYEMRLKKRGSL